MLSDVPANFRLSIYDLRLLFSHKSTMVLLPLFAFAIFYYVGGCSNMKTKSKLRGLRCFLATCASVACACVCVLLMANQYQTARFQLDTYEREYQGWEAFQKTNPAYFEDNTEAVKSCRKSLTEARNNSWVKLPKAQVAGLFIAAGLGSAAVGYLVTWIVLWLPGMALSRFVRWLALCMERKPQRRAGSRPASRQNRRPPGPQRASAPVSERNPNVRWDNQVTIRPTVAGPKCKV
jgi:hypothetical protein